MSAVLGTSSAVAPQTSLVEPESATATRPEPPDPASRATGDGLGWLVAGLLALVAARPLSDNSFFTHLATGRVLLEDGFPTTNPFLYSSSDFPIPSWWWSGALALAEQAAGAFGVRSLTAVVAALLGAAIVRLTRPVPPAPQHVVAVLVPALLTGVTLLPFLTPRPHVAGFLLMSLAVIVWREWRSPWWMVPIFATWVNVHGTWMYGLAIVGLYAVCEAVDDRRLNWRRFAPLATAVGGLLLGGLLYPQRLRLVVLPFEQMGDERSRQALASYMEWKPPGFGYPLTWCVIALGVAAGLGAIRQRRFATAAGAVVLVVLGMSAGRLLAVAALSLLPWAAAGLAAVGSIPRPSGRVASALRVIGITCCVAAVAVSAVGPHWDLSRYPVEAGDWLEARGFLEPDGGRIVTQDYVGNYLELREGPTDSLWMDDRPGLDTAHDYIKLNRLADGWPEALERAGGDLVVWADDEPLTRELAGDERWFQATSVGGFTVFCRAPIADRCR